LTDLSICDGWLFDVIARKRRDVSPDPALRILGDEEFLEAVYVRFLSRAADEGGKGHYLRLLQAGIARESVMEAIAASQEVTALVSARE
jgi:hypothetical protein